MKTRDVQEFADTSAGTVQTALKSNANTASMPTKSAVDNNPRLSVASKGVDGKVSFREIDNFQNLSK